MNLSHLFDLSGHNALVTGSSRGIGYAIATILAAAGANVVFHGSRPSENLNQAVREAQCFGVKAIGIPADLEKPFEIENLIEKSKAEVGFPDILVLNASTQKYGTIEDFEEAEFQREYRVNVQAAFLLIRSLLPDMKKKQWGRILSVGSVNQWNPSKNLPIYASTKAAQANLIKNCAKQYSKFGITANNLAPGVIATDRNREALRDETFCAELLKTIPAGRFGNPDDCAGLALLLCSNAGSYITGADIPVTGGMHL